MNVVVCDAPCVTGVGCPDRRCDGTVRPRAVCGTYKAWASGGVAAVAALSSQDTHPVPPRVQILQESTQLTGVERENEYGDPAVNLKLAGELKALLRLHRVRPIGPAEQEALDHVCVKLARIVTGPKPKRDSYVDGAAYFAIAGEMALKETT